MSICSSPSRFQLEYSQSLLETQILPGLLQQETHHAESKRPRMRYAGEADIKIQRILQSVHHVKGRLQNLEEELSNLEVKVDRLDLERENGTKHHLIHQLSFSMSPLKNPMDISCDSGNETLLDSFITPPSSAPPPPKRMLTRTSRRRLYNNNKHKSPAHFLMSPMSPKVLEYLRKKNLLNISLTRIFRRVKTEAEDLQTLFEANFNLLKFRRSEKCLLTMIKLQRKIKGMENASCQLKDRLLHAAEEF